MKKVSLSDGEWKIINLLWDKAPRSIRQITDDLAAVTGWDKHTVIVMLKRMEEKGVVSYETDGRAKQYFPVADRRQITQEATKGFLDKVYKGSLSRMLTAMVEQDSLSGEEIAQLQQILKDAGGNQS